MLKKQQNALYPNLFGMILSAYKRRIKNSFLYPKYSKDMTGYTKSFPIFVIKSPCKWSENKNLTDMKCINTGERKQHKLI
jgi:hypothetical protein